MGKKGQRVSTEASDRPFAANPFAGLDSSGLAAGPKPASVPQREPPAKAKRSRGRVDLIREKSGRGGKTVTVATAFKGISAEEKAELARRIQKRCGVGGAVKGGNIEIQGDKRAEAKAILEEAGFTVVFAGG